MIIRRAVDQDWRPIYPFYAAIMAEGKTYPFPERQTLDEARPWWMEEHPGQTVVAVIDGVIVSSAKMSWAELSALTCCGNRSRRLRPGLALIPPRRRRSAGQTGARWRAGG